MGYYIIKNRYAPKIPELTNKNYITNSHAVLVNYCNFKCKYCCIDYAGDKLYVNYSYEEFERKILELIPFGKYFKFSGGEPTLNPTLERDLGIVKKNGGIVFLDTNGSQPNVVKELIDSKLIDVLGISLKGIDRESALNNSGIFDKKSSWDNVLQSIEYAIKHEIRTIITYVLFEDTTFEMMNEFVHLFPPRSVYLKFNNFKSNGKDELKKMNDNDIEKNIEKLIKENEWIKDYLILISDERAVYDFEKIKFY